MRALALLVVMLAWAAPAHADDAADVSEMMAAAPVCEAGRAHCFGIRLHVARTEDGAMVVTPAWFAAQLAMANKQFTPLDTSFQLTEVEFLDASAARIEDTEARTALAKYKRGTVIDVFLTGYLGDVDKPGAFIRGVTWHTDDGGRLIILSAVGMDRTLAHELGHFFGLPHSKYAVSIMNKTKREAPPPEDRRFADAEIEKMKPVLKRLVATKVIAEVSPRAARTGTGS